MANVNVNRSNLTNLTALSQAYDQITAALASLNDPNVVVRVEISAPSSAGVILPLPVPVMTLQTLLTNKQTAIATQLTAAGITVGS
jgi:hypothetical protein